MPGQLPTKEPKRLLLKYSKLFTQCSAEASLYGKCVSLKADNIKKESCAKEFEQFKNCIKNVSRKL
jgi:NADH dehydrogenase [ubiquinone] 1 alpha subcomplex assembly factor 8